MIHYHLTSIATLRPTTPAMVLPSEDSPGSRTRTQRAVVEAAVGYTLILITLWSPAPVRGWVALAAAFWIFGSLLLSGEPGRGFGLGELRRCSWAVGLALAGAAAWIALAAHLGTLHFDSQLSARRPPMMGYLLSSLIQQIILQCFIMARMLVLLRRPWIANAAAAVLFSAAHLPNPLLVLATLLWGMAACWLFLRYRSLIGVAAIHFVLGVCVAICVPASLQHNMRVGLGYSRYHVPSRRAHTLGPIDAGEVRAAAVHRSSE
jgi:membrane protease YdiL (CAAX protease family)